MVICFKINSGAKTALDNLLHSGLYQDASEVICVSLINHDIIQREAQQNGGVEITRADLLDDRSPFVRGSRARLANPHSGQVPATGRKEIPDIFRLPQTGMAGDEFPHVADEIEPRAIAGPKQWLFGQYNKLLPLKATLRGLLNLSGPTRDGLSVTEATRTISTEAWLLGDYLDEIDRKSGATRENALSTAFPTTRGSGSPGQSRFASQFVVSVNAERIATGLPIAMRLAVYVSGKTPRLNLSRQGAKFALLENPVLDQGTSDQTKFSPTEGSFLVNHILKYVPEERSAFKIILGALSEGATTPKALDAFLSSHYADSTMTAAFLSLQRSGVISRLIDLQLVRRLRDGTRVTYVVTESAADVVAEISANETESIEKSY
jgi:hypothetical protein